ncbi:MAG: hypothetical protein QXE01_05905 [Sulfolobales archaeon]
MEMQSQLNGNGVTCPKCGRKAEFMAEIYSTDGMRRITYLYRCVLCRWRKEIETIYVMKREGKISVMRQRKT